MNMYVNNKNVSIDKGTKPNAKIISTLFLSDESLTKATKEEVMFLRKSSCGQPHVSI